MPDTNCLYTTVRNVSGGTLSFSFLPPHGKKLTDGENYTFFGDIFDHIRTGGRLNLRKKAGLENALLAANTLEICKTPSPIFYDVAATRIRYLDVTGGAVVVVDPCYGSYIGPC